jgi:homoaconitase/3-isopropylmalate dehydratase large subunit
MGPKDAQLFLGNPATVAASAVAGKIVDARTVMDFVQ